MCPHADFEKKVFPCQNFHAKLSAHSLSDKGYISKDDRTAATTARTALIITRIRDNWGNQELMASEVDISAKVAFCLAIPVISLICFAISAIILFLGTICCKMRKILGQIPFFSNWAISIPSRISDTKERLM